MNDTNDPHDLHDPHDPLEPIASAYAATLEKLGVAVQGRTRRSPDGTVLVNSAAPIATLNAIISPKLNPDPGVIASLAAAESPWDVPWSIHLRGEAASPQVAEVAVRYGLSGQASQPLMVRRPEQGLPEPSDAGSLRVRAVAPEEVELYTRTLAGGFEVPYELFLVLANPGLAQVEGITCYLAEVDGVPVGTAMTSIVNSLTGIFNVTTLPAHRRRGYGRMLTTELVRTGFAAGAPTVFLYSSKMGEDLYASLGFRTEESLTILLPEAAH